jgi:multiple sugar transport system substrate-binding protein
MKRKGFTFLAVMLALMLIIAGCGAKSDNNSSSSSGNTSSSSGGSSSSSSSSSGGSNSSGSEQVEITLNGWGASPEEEELLQQTLDEFMKKYPNIKVKYEVISEQYMDVIKTRLIGGQAGDVFYLDSSEAEALFAQNVLEPLNGYITDEFDIGDIEEPLLNAFKGEDGNYYGFPKDSSTLVLFYNKKHFEEAGLSGPPTTWEELREYSKILTKDGRYGLGVAPELARQMFMIEAYGGKVVDEDGKAAFATPEALQGLQLVIDQHLIDKTSVQPTEVGSGWGGEMFGQEKVSMVLEGNWAIPYLNNTFPDLEYGTAEVPTVNGKKVTMAYTVAYVMNKQSKHKEEAWKLIEFLTGKEGMKIWTSKGLALPTRKSVAAELGYDKDEYRAAIVAGSSYAIPWQVGKYGPIIMNNFNNQFISAFLGEQTLENAMKAAVETANKEIEAMQ